MLTKRNLNIEALRVYMMLLIVILHVTGSYLDNEEIRHTGGWVMAWIYGYRSLTFLGVTTFAFISGYYGIKFHLKKFVSMEVMAITYGVVVLIALYATTGGVSLRTIRQLLCPVTSGHLWYYSCYMILMVVAPLLNEGINSLSKPAFAKSLAALMALIYGCRFIVGGGNTDFYNLLLVYLLGRYLRLYPIAFLKEHCGKLFIVCVIINFWLMSALGYCGKGLLNYHFEGNNNPVTALAAISLFYTFLQQKKVLFVNRWVSTLAPFMLAVYVLHELARTMGVVDFKDYHADILVVVPMACAIVVGISVIEKVRNFLATPLINMIKWKQ